jgi:hypothetical protein
LADISITAANVVAGANARTLDGIAGATITAGQLVYRDSVTGKYLLSDADSATVAARSVDGIALNSASLNQPLGVQIDGEITIGGTLTANAVYILSGTAGGIAPLADLSTGEYYVQVGVAKSTSVLDIGIQATGVAA